jgi:hypothetical protein
MLTVLSFVLWFSFCLPRLGRRPTFNLARGHESLPIGNDSQLALAKALADIARSPAWDRYLSRWSFLKAPATHKLAGEGFKRPWSPLIKMDESTRKKIDVLFSK